MVKITALTDLPTPVAADLVAVIDDVAGSATTKKATLDNILAVYDTQTSTMTNKTLVAPALGTPSSGNLSSCTNLTGALDTGGADVDNIQNLIHDISVTTVALSFTADQLQTISAAGTLTFTCATYTAGSSKTIKILDSGSGQTLAFPAAWIFVGTKPTAIAASKTGILTITSFTTAESGVIAAYVEQE
jgi:hypothetical protein